VGQLEGMQQPRAPQVVMMAMHGWMMDLARARGKMDDGNNNDSKENREWWGDANWF
jgi:hypothetical protein